MAESKYLNGMGIARERKAIVDGLRGSVEEFSETVEGATPKDVMDLILLTQCTLSGVVMHGQDTHDARLSSAHSLSLSSSHTAQISTCSRK